MSNRLVDVTLNKLIKVSEIFNQLNPHKLTKLLSKSLGTTVQYIPQFLANIFLLRTSKDLILKAEQLIDLKQIVINGLTTNPRVLGQFFQKVAYKELAFLIDSGFGLGFILGIFQMLQWMVSGGDMVRIMTFLRVFI